MRGRWMAFAAGRAAGRNDASMKQQTSGSSSSSVDELEKLTQMHDEGALTDDEFKKAKKNLIGK